ncbi:MAG TPA: hypothetical protein VK659_19450 [Asanoa sp.]|nr:hypothetical protein [Asanoa sp.]
MNEALDVDPRQAAAEHVRHAIEEYVSTCGRGVLVNYIVVARTAAPDGGVDYGFLIAENAPMSDCIGLAIVGQNEFAGLIKDA